MAAGSEKVAVYKRTIESLEGTIGGIRAEAVQAEEQGITIMLAGLLVLLGVKFVQAAMANTVLEKRYSNWLSDKTISAGMTMKVFSHAIC